MHIRTKGAIAAGDELTAEAGSEILKVGGNAFDAAVAATIMTFAASSTITSMAGGGYMMAAESSGKRHLLDFFVQTPKSRRPVKESEFYPVIVDFGDKKQEFHVGRGTSATPGNLAGLFEIHKRYCRLPFSELVAPAIDASKKGIKLHSQTKYQADILKPILSISKTGRDIYFEKDQIKALGNTYVLPEFADFLEFIGNNGPREFYEGEIARKISGEHQEYGGHLTMDDFLSYRVIERDPISVPYRDHHVYLNAPPNAGGPLIAFTLSLLNQFPLKKSDWGSLRHLNLLAQAIEHTSLVRDKKLNNKFNKTDLVETLLDKRLLDIIVETIQKELHKSGNTTHVSTADEFGNFVAITTSVGEGCGHYLAGTQIMMNNMLGEEDLNPTGFHHWKTNTRMSSMMSPSLLCHKNKPVAVLGSGGSNRIRSAIVQAISNHIDFKMDPDDTVNAPRIHWERNHLDVEPGYNESIIHDIILPPESEIIKWTAKNMYFGGVHAVFKDGHGNLVPAGDRRRAGAVRVIV